MKNNDMKRIIVGIDHGYKNMKTANTMFPTAISKVATLPDDKSGIIEMISPYNGEIYTENGDAIPYVDSSIKSDTEDFYILTLICIAKEMARKSLTRARVKIVAGLPQRWYEGQKESFEKYLTRYEEVRFKYQGERYHIEIEGVTLYTQGYAAYMTSNNIAKYMNREVCVCDIGGGTMDIIPVRNGKVINTECKIDTRATIWLINEIKEQVETELCQTIPESIIIDYMTRGSKNEAPKNKYEEVMKKVLIKYTQMVYQKLKESRINTDLIPLIFVGGGAVVIKRFGTYDENNTEFITDLSANAKGYEKVYRLLME